VSFDRLERKLGEIGELLLDKLAEILPLPEGEKEQSLFEAMRYSTLSRGKRLRPFLTVETAQLFGVSLDSSLQTAAAVELIAKAAGFSGMVGGQVIDILAQNSDLDFNEIVRLQRMKTGALFAISCEAGAILGKAPRNLRNCLRAYANNLGLAFQITDDLLDVEGTREETGKAVRKDANAAKATLVSCLGIEPARAHAKMLATQAIEHLAVFGDQASMLRELAEYVISRTK